MPKEYSPDFRERAVRLVVEAQEEGGRSRMAACQFVGQQLGVGPAALQRWCGLLVPAGGNGVVGPDESATLKQLRREHAELRRANEILRTASAFFAAERGRPTLK